MARRARTLAVARATVAVAVGLALAACTSSGADPSAVSPTSLAPSPTAPASIPEALVPLVPVYPATVSADTVKAETLRVANSIQALILKSQLVFVDDHSQFAPAANGTGQYFGVLRTINLSPTVDAVAQATAIAKLLTTAGWIERNHTEQSGSYLVALSSAASGSKAWFLILGGDTTVAKQPVVTLQLASPDLP